MITPEELAKQMAEKTDHQLQEMFDRAEDWTPEALDASWAELQKRKGCPAETLNPAKEAAVKKEEALKTLPTIPFKKALNLDQNFRSWRQVLTLWVIFGFFALCKDYTDYDNYKTAVGFIRVASSDLSRVKPQFVEMVNRLSPHIDQLETLKTVFELSGFISLAGWVFTIFVSSQFERKTPAGPKMLLGLLCAMFAFDVTFAITTWNIPSSEMRDLVDLDQFRILPFARLFLIIGVIPFFSKHAPTYYQYVRLDKDVFSRTGAIWRFLTPQEIAKRVRMLQSRRRRSVYAIWAFIVSAAILILNVDLIVKGQHIPGVVRVLAFISGLIVLWTIVESTMLASALFEPSAAILLGGFLTYGILSCVVISVLRRKVVKELALAPSTQPSAMGQSPGGASVTV
jgi:hypothetical protein